jgi:tRNA (guanine-N7-)-methyltransferase
VGKGASAVPTIIDVGNGQTVAHPTVYGLTMTEAPQLRSYGRRKGRPLSARKERLLTELLPRLRLNLKAPAPSRLRELFPIPVDQVWLEIGFGSGEHLLWQAERHSDVGLIGCEPFLNGVASLLGAIEQQGLSAMRVHDGDAREVLTWLPDGAISRIFMLFPDPWPKKRQLKRRLLAPDAVREFARVLTPGGELRFASDDADYAAQALVLIGQSGEFEWLAMRPGDWRERPADWPETRYERKALREGRTPTYLRWRHS